MILRKCKICGLEATNEIELKLFRIHKPSKYGYRNCCKKCATTIKYPSKKEGAKKRVSIRGKRFYLPINPRIGICSTCGKNGKTVLHHTSYDEERPLAYTIELCRACHSKLHLTPFETYMNSICIPITPQVINETNEILIKTQIENALHRILKLRNPNEGIKIMITVFNWASQNYSMEEIR